MTPPRTPPRFFVLVKGKPKPAASLAAALRAVQKYKSQGISAQIITQYNTTGKTITVKTDHA